MFQITFKLAACFLALIVCINGADKYTDENRPYEFGFTIDGEQHRHEKKDENGIIMGEFGFITADGVYHVTVYATDEQGRFKILSMKNIRVKPYPTAGVKKGHSIPFPPSENAPVLQGPSTSKPQESTQIQTNKQIPSSVKSCSHCSIPTTTTKAPPQLTDIAVVSRDGPVQGTFEQGNNYQQEGISSHPNYPSQETGNVNYHQQDANPNLPQQGNYENDARKSDEKQSSPASRASANEYYPQDLPKETEQNIPNVNQNYPQQNDNNYVPQSSFGQPQDGDNPQPIQGGTLRNPKQYTEFSPSNDGNSQLQEFDAILASQNNPPVSNKPTLVAAQMQIVPKDTDIYQNRPGEKQGLPDGLSKDDMTRLLYTFNYTVGFHGHHEEGYTNGAKQGYYYTTGRNGVRIRVDYVADERGFRPKISQEVLDVLSDDVPKPETEKEERFGLKGYEFKWLYYPTEARKK